MPTGGLTRANSLLAMNEDLSAVFAPILGGFLVGALGLRPVLILDVLSLRLAALALLVIRFPSPRPSGSEPSVLSLRGYPTDFGQGLTYLRERPGLLALVWGMALLNFTPTITLPLITPLLQPTPQHSHPAHCHGR